MSGFELIKNCIAPPICGCWIFIYWFFSYFPLSSIPLFICGYEVVGVGIILIASLASQYSSLVMADDVVLQTVNDSQILIKPDSHWNGSSCMVFSWAEKWCKIVPFGLVFKQEKETDNFCSCPALGKICWEYCNPFLFYLYSSLTYFHVAKTLFLALKAIKTKSAVEKMSWYFLMLPIVVFILSI